MYVYTIIIQFQNATNVVQVSSTNEQEALINYFTFMYDYGNDIIINKANIVETIKDDKPILIKGMKNVWCADQPSIFGEYMSINILKTLI